MKDSLQNLERHRAQLEENVAKLRKGLQHWRRWDAEYETLKDEIESAPKPVTQKDLARIRAEFKSDVIDRKELDEIFGNVGIKPADQIVNVLSRRIDYVTKNLETLEKQLEIAEEKYAAASIITDPDMRDEEGLPMSEIIEELDEDGAVISSRVQKPGDAQTQLEELLKKAGIKDIPQGGSASEQISNSAPVEPKTEATATQKVSPKAPAQRALTTQAPPAKKHLEFVGGPSSSEGLNDGGTKKSVSFTEDTKAGEETEKSRTAIRVEQIMQTAKDQEQLARSEAVVPEDESEEDAFLRREMLKYGMGEVGAVVAELTLEEATDDDEGFDEEYSEEDEEEDDEEDKYGRSLGSVIDDDYRQRMLELEKRLGIKSRFTEQLVEQDTDSDDNEPEGLGRVTIQQEPRPSSQAPPAETALSPRASSLKSSVVDDGADEKKSVRFAADLDIAPDDVPSAPQTSSEPARPFVEPLSDIVERSGPSQRPEQTSKPVRKASRFKKNRGEAATAAESPVPKGPLDVPVRFLDQDRPIAPTGPLGKTIAESVLERESTSTRAGEEYNDDFMDQDLADEYHQKRRNFIQKHGGFLQEDESPIQPLDEADGGQKMSRFRAARLSKQ
ncbi:hypothetical protein VD0004_g1508 [Verticillium dahliae]|nr:hypothetical protein VD0004_g1508 [Verticillium dahliae]PNH75802.1 hypothetical protein VD0001_g1776 [Verticillium dahliae]